jgi:hypothetical protein
MTTRTAFLVLLFVILVIGLFVGFAKLAEHAGDQARRDSRPLPMSTMEIIGGGANSPAGRLWLLFFVACQLALAWLFWNLL